MEEASLKMNGFSPATPAPVLWKSRKRSGYLPPPQWTKTGISVGGHAARSEQLCSPLRFEPLEPVINLNGKRPSAESLLPPPDFESSSYPRGWLIGKKQKLVNMDVIESMCRIAVQEMNRKDREIDGLNEQLEEDVQCLEHLQTQLLEERSKSADLQRQNEMLQNQVGMLMDILQEIAEEAMEEGS